MVHWNPYTHMKREGDRDTETRKQTEKRKRNSDRDTER